MIVWRRSPKSSQSRYVMLSEMGEHSEELSEASQVQGRFSLRLRCARDSTLRERLRRTLRSE
ncbi:MAG: hypothetical protein SAQ54_12475 [Oscillatoria sp. PMC 1050.18]|nr:hypothetical protein [Oscillatoria sp. PMC 1050.18]